MEKLNIILWLAGGRGNMAGCGNHGCFIEKPKGQGTNGRCNCLRELGKENEQAVKRKLSALDAISKAVDISQVRRLLIQYGYYD